MLWRIINCLFLFNFEVSWQSHIILFFWICLQYFYLIFFISKWNDNIYSHHIFIYLISLWCLECDTYYNPFLTWWVPYPLCPPQHFNYISLSQTLCWVLDTDVSQARDWYSTEKTYKNISVLSRTLTGRPNSALTNINDKNFGQINVKIIFIVGKT